jgi:hypothetical protein
LAADADTPRAGDARFRLPVCGRTVALRPPTGAEDLVLLESAAQGESVAADAKAAAVLAESLARPADGHGAIDWGGVCVTDMDALLLCVRRLVLGDRVRAEMTCPVKQCGRRFDITFGVTQYLAERGAPSPPRRQNGRWTVEPAEESGWWRVSERAGDAGEPLEAIFRLPSVSDQAEAAGHPRPEQELARRCVRPHPLPARLRRRVEAAMEALAPSLVAELRAACPECGAEVMVFFDARRFCLRELRGRASFLFQEVDLLARRYHWPEAEILAMPLARRASYVELAGLAATD